MKTVCILVQSHYEHDIRIRRKAEALLAAGYAVDVIALQPDAGPPTPYVVDGVNVHPISLGKRRGSVLRYLFEYGAFFCAAFFKLARLMRRRHYALVDVNTLPDFLVFAAWYARRKGATVILDMHEITPEFYMSKYGVREGSCLIRLIKYLERISMRFADHVITINEPIQALLVSRGLNASKATIVMNSVDESMYASVTAAAASPRPAGPGKPFVLMYHGTLTEIYGLDIAIQALSQVQDQMPDAELWILGDGPHGKRLESLSAELGLQSRVKFVGRVLPQEIPQWLSRCDLGVLPTRQDVFLDYSFSNKLSEYIIMDKPVICSRLRTIRHYFSEEALAFFEPMNSESLSKQMLRLYQDVGLRSRLARVAQQEYAPIRWHVMKERYMSLIRRLAGPPSASGEVLPPSARSARGPLAEASVGKRAFDS